MHWPNPCIPVEDTIKAIEQLIDDGKIRHMGVSNCYWDDLDWACSPKNKHQISSLQIEYNLFDRFIEEEVMSLCIDRQITIIAYSPLDQGHVVDGDASRFILNNLANKYNKTVPQIALNWVIQHKNVVAIPKATNIEHLKYNADAMRFVIEQEDIEKINVTCKGDLSYIEPKKINISEHGEGNRKVYRTLEEAIDNQLNFVPSPSELSQSTKNDNKIKPVRVIKNIDDTYDLVEGRIRYWAWVIAYGWERSIPCYVRKNFYTRL